MERNRWAALLLVVSSAGSAAIARADDPQRLEPVICTASRIPTPLDQVTASTSVVTRADIEAQQPESTLDVLRELPGVHVEQPGGRGSVTSLFTRGGDPNHTLVLIDGIPVNDQSNTRGGSYDFSTVDVGSIERIEVVRGPLSAVYGSDAIAGVVNVTTLTPSRDVAYAVQGRGGTVGDHREGVSVRGPVGPAAIALSGVYDDDGAPVEGDVARSGGFTGRLEAPLADVGALHLATRFAQAHAESFPDDSGGPEFAVLRTTDHRDVREFSIGATPEVGVAPWLTMQLQTSYYDRTEQDDSPGVAPGKRDPAGIPPNRADTTLRQTVVGASALATPVRALAFTLGAEALLTQGDSDGALVAQGRAVPTSFRLDRQIYAPFLEMQYAPIADLRLYAGARGDFPNGFMAEASPRVGAAYTFARSETTIRATWGRGFKLPSFFALGNPVVGNPHLQPERGTSFDAGIVQALGPRARVGLTYFQSRTENLIDFEEGPPPRLVNRNVVDTHGVEAEATFRPLDTVTVSSTLTQLSTDIVGTDEKLRSRPDWQGSLSARWRPRRDLTLSLTGLFVGHVLDSSIPTGDVTLAPYGQVDIAAIWSIATRWDVSLAVDNLFDAHFERAVGFAAPGPWLRVGVRFHT